MEFKFANTQMDRRAIVNMCTLLFASFCKMQNWFIASFMLLIFVGKMQAQVSSKNKITCPEDQLYKSFLYAKNNNYTKAKSVLFNIIATYPKCAEAYSRLSDLCYRTNDSFYTVQHCMQTISLNANKGFETVLQLHQTMLEYKDNAFANSILQQALQSNNLDALAKNKIRQLLEQSEAKQKLMTNYVTAQPQKLSNKINSKTTQCFPSLTLDGKKLFYTNVIQERNEDFFVSEIVDSCSTWSIGENIGAPPNTSGPEGASQISADGNYLFFTKCDQRSANGYDGGGCDIFFCYKTADGWSSPEKFKSTINSMHYEGQPCLNSVNNEMYFVSDRKGGFGGYDIYKSKFEHGLWQEPINLGATINTIANEESPFIHPDNNTLYFVSNRAKGVGGQDIYVAKKVKDSLWQNVQNLGYPINTTENENSICVAANGIDALLASNRDANNFDIYSVGLPSFAQATATHCVQGILYDKINNDALTNMELQVFDSAQNFLQKIKTNDGDGSYTFPLKAGAKYFFSITNVEGYKDFTEEINLQVSQKALPIIKANAYLKLIDGLDTLYQTNFFGAENADTTLYNLTHDVPNWHTQKVDSVVLFCTLTNNNYVDTTWLQNTCLSDSLYTLYTTTQIEKQRKQEQEVNEYFEFFIRYLYQKKVPFKNIVLQQNSEAWLTNERYKLKVIAVEYY